MAIPENEEAGKQCRSDLIRDISRSAFGVGGSGTSEQHLMRLAGDPLLIREFVLRKNPSGPIPQASSPLSGDVTVAVARGMVLHGSLQQAGGPPQPKQYEKREPLFEVHVSPSVFRPSARDREAALEHDSPQPLEIASAAGVWRSRAALAALTLAAVLVSLLLMLVPD